MRGRLEEIDRIIDHITSEGRLSAGVLPHGAQRYLDRLKDEKSRIMKSIAEGETP